MLAGKTALVTGARGGIGRAIVGRFLKEGAVVYAADLTPEGSLSAHDDDESVFVKLDVTRENDAIAAFEQVRAEHGKLDILVNAAGIEIEKTVEDTTLDEWNRSFAVNSTGTFLTSKYALPLMREAAKSGRSASLINFGSYDGFIADPGLAAYCATKGAVHALTRAMACDHGPEGIRVNAICPGYIDTPMPAGLLRRGRVRWWRREHRNTSEGSTRCASTAHVRDARRHCQPGELAGLGRGAVCVGAALGS